MLGLVSNDGVFTGWFIVLLKGLFGWGYWFVPVAALWCAILLFGYKKMPVMSRVLGISLIPVALGAVYQLIAGDTYELNSSVFSALWNGGQIFESGGAVGGIFAVIFTYIFGKVGAIVLQLAILIIFVMLALHVGPARVLSGARSLHGKVRERMPERPVAQEYEDYDEPRPVEQKQVPVTRVETVKPNRGNKTISAFDIPIDEGVSVSKELPTTRTEVPDDSGITAEAAEPVQTKPERRSLFDSSAGVKTPDQFLNEDSAVQDEEVISVSPELAAETQQQKPEPVKINGKKSREKTESLDNEMSKIEEEIADSAAHEEYRFPPLELLSGGTGRTSDISGSEVQQIKERLEMTLHSFGINSVISNITRGPSVTRYELELEIGVKLNKLTSLSEDISLALGASGVRIAAIPNKISTVGIEVPNRNISTVYLRDIIDSQEFRKASSNLTFAMGEGIGGNAVVGNIAKLPHLLVAGTTGSGKSVALNSLILSILYKSKPDDVKFILVDPKMVEFKIYNGIPHLLVPVVTEAKKAAGALQWAVVEMMKRYALFSDTGARDLKSYNELCANNEELE
ncbi:MAG: DNA translocase FtsK, partial [Oscillospiraceae bacterium]|nr:DNA translocase FtsK [Oscillospiraceae bacterium]